MLALAWINNQNVHGYQSDCKPLASCAIWPHSQLIFPPLQKALEKVDKVKWSKDVKLTGAQKGISVGSPECRPHTRQENSNSWISNLKDENPSSICSLVQYSAIFWRVAVCVSILLEDWWGLAKLVGQFKEISADCLFRNIRGGFPFTTGWSKATVTNNISLTNLKNAKNGLTQPF